MKDLKSQSKTWLFRMLSGVVICWVCSVLVSLYANPEVKFWSSLVAQKTATAKQLRSSENGPIIFVGGGSSASFSIHPKVLEKELGIPAVNMGGSGAMGYRYLVNLAFSEARAGDIVILHMTPESLADRETATKALGIRVALRNGHLPFAEGGDILEPSPLGIGDTLLALRPGTKFLGTIAAKIVSGRPLYSYSVNHYNNGVITMPNGGPTEDVEGFSPASSQFNKDTAKTLQEIVQYAQARKIQVFFTLPWECFKSEVCPAMRKEHEEYIEQVELHMPVLRDLKSGAHDRPEDFLDTGFHMTLEAGEKRTQILAQSLREMIDLESPQ